MAKSFYTLLWVLVILALSACSVKKDSLKNRTYHNMTSWFNTLFNGQVAMDQRLEELKDGHKDDYFEVLRVDPYDEFKVNMNPTDITAPAPTAATATGPRGTAGQFVENTGTGTSTLSGFEKAEEKALKVIANHSMMIRGQEKNRLIERAYLMLGQARYYQGKPFQALDALQYARSLPFSKHETEADYFAALAQVQAGNKYAAAEMLDPMYNNEDLDKQTKANVAKQLAWLFYQENDLESALNGLDTAIEFTRSKEEEARLNYIQGQLLTKLGRFDEANEKYNRAFRLKPGFEMEARSQVAVALNYDPLTHNYTDFSSRMNKMYNTGTYETYRNEFMYALGKIEEKRDSVKLAEAAYLKALREEQSDPRFRAETFAAVGDLKFRQSDYVYAGAYYDSAVTAITEGPRKEEITLFRDNLRSVTDKYYLVQRNDSILRIAGMSDSERNKFFEDYIAELKRNDELRRQEEEEQATQFLTQTRGNTFSNSFEDNSGKFYFYSASAKSNGESEFRRIWGDRQLRDNWRLSSAGSSVADQKAELTGTANVNNPRRYELDYYLEQIPTNAAALRNLKVERDTTELSLGLDYFDKFKDARLATTTLEHLISTPPESEDVLLKSYYNLYRINAEKNPVLSAKYKDLVLNNFPNTIYAEFILNPQMDFSEENSPEVLALYREAFDAYKAEDYPLVKEKVTVAFEEHPMAKITGKFALLNAYADAQLSGAEAYRASLERILVLYPGTEEADHAQYLLDLMDGKAKKEAPAEVPGEFSEPGNQLPAEMIPPQQNKPVRQAPDAKQNQRLQNNPQGQITPKTVSPNINNNNSNRQQQRRTRQ